MINPKHQQQTHNNQNDFEPKVVKHNLLAHIKKD